MNTKLISIILLSFFLLLTLVSPKVINAQGVTYEGEITKIIEENGNYQKIEVTSSENVNELESGQYETSNNIKYEIGDRIVVSDDQITDYVRRPSLYILFAIFLLLTFIIAGKWGLTSVFGMAYSFYIIFKFILPLIIKGYNPVRVSIIGAVFIIPVTFSMSHGINRKTINAIIGTLTSMVIVGLLSVFFVNLSKLSGFAVEEAGFLQYQLGGIINMKGLLLAGIIISTLGVMDDITISQASVVEELKKANPKLSKKELFMRSMNVGRDHISSMVNTLVLVYAGASLPLLLLFVESSSIF